VVPLLIPTRSAGRILPGATARFSVRLENRPTSSAIMSKALARVRGVDGQYSTVDSSESSVLCLHQRDSSVARHLS